MITFIKPCRISDIPPKMAGYEKNGWAEAVVNEFLKGDYEAAEISCENLNNSRFSIDHYISSRKIKSVEVITRNKRVFLVRKDTKNEQMD